MGIGIRMFIEVYPSWTGQPIATCLTPGGVFLFHNRVLFQALGLQLDRPDIPAPLIPCRGWPNAVSKEIVQESCLFVSEEASSERTTRNKTKLHSLRDEQEWIHWGLKIVEIRNVENYPIEVPPKTRCIFNPGNEKPSWLNARELLDSLVHSNFDIEDPHDDENEKHNACVFRWVIQLGEVHGDENVRIVFWFDSVGQEFL